MSEKVLLLDAGLGNLRSVERALRAAGLGDEEGALRVSADPDAVARASRVVFPGQGAFRDAAAALDRDGGALREALHAFVAKGAPYLGLCLGLQVLFDESEEAPGARGLGLLAGRVVRFENAPSLKVPHMGWNEVRGASEEGARAFGLDPRAGRDGVPGPWFYFVHSYHGVPSADRACVALESTHGAPFVAAVARDNVRAVQFHPEKSQGAGLALLRSWLDS